MADQNTPNQQPAPQQSEPAPTVSEDEMKMPEEQFGTATPAAQSPSVLVPALVGLLIVLLVALGALIVWGDEIMGVLVPTDEQPAAEVSEETGTESMTNDDAAPATNDDTTADLEAELESTDFSDVENDLNAIDAELESEASAEAN